MHAVIPYATALVAALLGAVAGAYVIVLVPRAVDGQPLLRPFPGVQRPARDLLRAVRDLSRGDAGVLAVTAVAFAALALRLGPNPALPAYLYLAVISVALGVVDIRTRRLPNAITLPSYPVSIALLGLAAVFVEQGLAQLVRALVGMAALYVLYLVLFLIHPRGMGFGDVKLAGLLGLYLGWFGIDVLLVGAFLGYVLGGLYGVVAIIAGRATRKTAIPFGPFMIGGALLGIFVGDPLAALYLSL